jgi:hypothetical protein
LKFKTEKITKTTILLNSSSLSLLRLKKRRKLVKLKILHAIMKSLSLRKSTGKMLFNFQFTLL